MNNNLTTFFHVGKRGKEDAEKFYQTIPEIFKERAVFFTDYWSAYAAIIPDEKHFAVGKER